MLIALLSSVLSIQIGPGNQLRYFSESGDSFIFTGCLFTQCMTADGRGSAIHIDNANAQVTISDSMFSTCSSTGAADNADGPGTISLTGFRLELQRICARSCTSVYGGCLCYLYCYDSSRAQIDFASAVGCGKTSGNGGAVFPGGGGQADGTYLNFTDCYGSGRGISICDARAAVHATWSYCTSIHPTTASSTFFHARTGNGDATTTITFSNFIDIATPYVLDSSLGGMTVEDCVFRNYANALVYRGSGALFVFRRCKFSGSPSGTDLTLQDCETGVMASIHTLCAYSTFLCPAGCGPESASATFHLSQPFQLTRVAPSVSFGSRNFEPSRNFEATGTFNRSPNFEATGTFGPSYRGKASNIFEGSHNPQPSEIPAASDEPGASDSLRLDDATPGSTECFTGRRRIYQVRRWFGQTCLFVFFTDWD
jgi:hypothetical protein